MKLNGWLIIDKPSGVNSTKVVNIVKRLTGAGKVGHAGTLDPMASGILPIALGEATKAVQLLVDAEKTYQFTVKFGVETNTGDAEGKIIRTSGKFPTKEEIVSVLPEFVGEIEQVPPIFSAIKIKGKRSYDLARSGKLPELAARKVKIYTLRLTEDSKVFGYDQKVKEVSLEMTCGKGTYVRSLGRDLARKLGSCGHISFLRRSKVGNFSEKNAILLDKLEKLLHITPRVEEFENILPVEAVLDGIPVLRLDSSLALKLKNGKKILLEDVKIADCYKSDYKKDDNICVLSEGKLIAIARLEENILKPVRVFGQ